MLAGVIGGWEIVLILAVFLILLAAKNPPLLIRGLGRGFGDFGRGVRNAAKELDDEAVEAGRSLGGIYGKPALEALTSENQVAEMYDPASGHDPRRKGFLPRLYTTIRRIFGRVIAWFVGRLWR